MITIQKNADYQVVYLLFLLLLFLFSFCFCFCFCFEFFVVCVFGVCVSVSVSASVSVSVSVHVSVSIVNCRFSKHKNQYVSNQLILSTWRHYFCSIPPIVTMAYKTTRLGIFAFATCFAIWLFHFCMKIEVDLNSSPFRPATNRKEFCRYELNKTHSHFEMYDITDMDSVPQNFSLACPSCFPGGFHIIHEPIGLCRVWPGQEMDFIDVLFLILSSPADEQVRINIRQSWISITEANRAPRFRHMFVLGMIEDLDIQRRIDVEQTYYGDILQKDMPEGYINITIKVVEGLRWATLHCPRTHYIMKVDTDSFVNIAGLMSVISSMGPEGSLFGACTYTYTPFRDPEHLWYIPFQLYPPSVFAPYCLGAGYVLTSEAAIIVVQIARDMPPIGLEDVFVGLCLREFRLQGNPEHRIYYVRKFAKYAKKRICDQRCQDLQRAVVWHKAESWFMACAWNSCYRHVCERA